MKSEPRRLGAGITAFEGEVVAFDVTDKSDVAALADRLGTFLADPFEKTFEPWVESAKRNLADYRPLAEPGYVFKPHEDAGWYYAEIVERGQLARDCVIKGDVKWAIFHAAHLGILIGEARIKFAWEERALYGEARLRDRDAAAAATRIHPIERRVEMVAELINPDSQFPTSLRRAFEIVASKLAISKGTVSRDWYKYKKRSRLKD